MWNGKEYKLGEVGYADCNSWYVYFEVSTRLYIYVLVKFHSYLFLQIDF